MSENFSKVKNNINWLFVAGIVLAILIAFSGIALSNYIIYLSIKQQNEVIQTVNHKDWSAEQLQGLFNSKTNE